MAARQGLDTSDSRLLLRRVVKQRVIKQVSNGFEGSLSVSSGEAQGLSKQIPEKAIHKAGQCRNIDFASGAGQPEQEGENGRDARSRPALNLILQPREAGINQHRLLPRAVDSAVREVSGEGTFEKTAECRSGVDPGGWKPNPGFCARNGRVISRPQVEPAQPIQQLIHQSQQKLPLAPEMQVKTANGHAGPRRNLVNRGCFEPPLSEEGQAGGEDPGTLLAAALLER